jgi:hypothetical protein
VGEVPDPLARHVDVPAVVGVVTHALLHACEPCVYRKLRIARIGDAVRRGAPVT